MRKHFRLHLNDREFRRIASQSDGYIGPYLGDTDRMLLAEGQTDKVEGLIKARQSVKRGLPDEGAVGH